MCTIAGYAVTFYTLSNLLRQGKVKMETTYIPGQCEGILAPKSKFIMVE